MYGILDAMTIPVIDLFAGPGGLGEGFSSLDGPERFELKLSIEKDASAHRTLRLRALYRRLDDKAAYHEYRRTPAAQRTLAYDRLVSAHPTAAAAADNEARCLELGPAMHAEVKDRISQLLRGKEHWVLIGGPPCQAYSLVGRSRMRRVRGEAFEADQRHFLYQEYLKIIADHRPPIFVMENVKGLLSSTHDGGRIFERILHDLQHPLATTGRIHDAAQYEIHPVVDTGTSGVSRFIVRAEEHGIPQARHRVILVGVRKDVSARPVPLAASSARFSAWDVIGDLPPLRSGVSKAADGPREWHDTIAEGVTKIRKAYDEGPMPFGSEVLEVAARAGELSRQVEGRGDSYIEWSGRPHAHADWYADTGQGGITGHVTRGHMASDIWRYLYAASFATVVGRSPSLTEFPPSLLPAHNNIDRSTPPIFADRFRVQVRDRPSTTVTSHISKDGHGFIHFDPRQARSLTAREAARLQTFPDSYEFEGARTAQLHQIGNAVPPLLARKIAMVVRDLLK